MGIQGHWLALLGLWAATTVASTAPADELLQQRHAAPRPPPPRFLHQASSKFAVNGSAIPDIDFDVGESYAGLLPVSAKANETDHLFFWFFPTVSKEHGDKKEIVVWLNGGPGCSSFKGFLQENGPFLWQQGTPKPQANPWSWNLLTNVVWVEQPVTVGFSRGNISATDDDDLAEQFLGFWKNFIDTFRMHGWKVYVTGQSYAGYFCPYIASHMMDANDSRYFNLAGMLIYDGVMFDRDVQINAVSQAYVEQHYALMPFDDAAMKRLRNVSQSCGFDDWTRSYLTYPPAGQAPRLPPGSRVLANGTVERRPECGNFWTAIYHGIRIVNPCFNVYNIRASCPRLSDSLGTKPYFDRADVKKAINAPLDVNWFQCVRHVYNSATGDQSLPPDQHELPRVVDKTKNVMLVHGSMDFVLPLNGLLVGLQNMTWGGKLGFQTAPRDPFYVPLYGFDPQAGTEAGYYAKDAPTGPEPAFYARDLPAGSGVQGTAHHERGLTLVVMQLAGHEGPGFAPAGALRQLEKLLGRVHSLTDTTPFTLPPLTNVTQMVKPLGRGTVRIPCMERGC